MAGPVARRALVLGGGGVAGIAWELGLLAGLAERGVDLVAADTVIGTSAGAAVGAQVAGGTPIEDLVARQLDPASAERPAAMDPAVMDEIMRAFVEEPDARAARRRVGQLALAAATPDEASRRAIVAARLPVPSWSERDLRITSVDAATGELAVFDRTSGVDLVDAVAASCAVPGVWPPVTIGAARYVDGGVRSGTNVDLAAGATSIVVVAPMPDPALPDQLARLAQGGARVALVQPDEAATAAIGPNPLDPSVRPAAAAAGRAQAASVADEVAGAWR